MTVSKIEQGEDQDRLTDTLKEIELTPEGKIPQKELVFVTDPDVIHVLEDPVRLAIVKTLRRGIPDTITTRTKDEETGDLIIRQREVRRHALSVIEIVKLSNSEEDLEPITKNQVYHHLPKLIDAGLVVKYGTVTTGKRTTDYYRRTAKGFILASTPLNTQTRLMKTKVTQSVERLDKIFGFKLSEEQRKELASLIIAAWKIEATGRTKVAKMIKGDVVDTDVLDLYEFLVNIYDMGIKEWLDTQMRIRAILFPDE